MHSHSGDVSAMFWHVECVEHGGCVCRALLEKACGACPADMFCARRSSSEDESAANLSRAFLLRGHAACRYPLLADLVKRANISRVEVLQRMKLSRIGCGRLCFLERMACRQRLEVGCRALLSLKASKGRSRVEFVAGVFVSRVRGVLNSSRRCLVDRVERARLSRTCCKHSCQEDERCTR